MFSTLNLLHVRHENKIWHYIMKISDPPPKKKNSENLKEKLLYTLCLLSFS